MNRLLIALVLLASAAAAAAQSLTAEQAWIRSAPPGAAMLAGYVRLHNAGSTELRIVEADSDAFGSIEIHETTHEDGMARMRRVPELTIAAGGSVELAPGGLHLMLMQPKRKLMLGDLVVIELVDADGEALPISFKVRSMSPESGHEHHEHDHGEHDH